MTGAWFMTSLTLVGAPRTVAASRSSALAYSAATRSAGCTAYQPPVGGAPGADGEQAGGRAVPVRGSEPGDGRVGRIAVPAVGDGSDNPAVSDLVVRPSRVTTASASGYADVDVQCAPGKVRAIDLVNQAPVRSGVSGLPAVAGADGCLAYEVYGADLARGALDVYIGVPGGACGGDAAGSYYQIRDRRVVATVAHCGDCDPPDSTVTRLTAPYRNRPAAGLFTIRSGGASDWRLVGGAPG